MNTSQLLIAAACSLTVIGASSVAFAQPTPDTSNSGAANQYPNQNQNQYPNQNQNQYPGQNSDRTSSTGSNTSGNMNSTTERQSGTVSDSTGTRMGRSSDDTMRTNTDGSPRRSERLARADRN